MDCHFLLQGIFPIQGSNLGLPRYRWMLYHLSHQGSPLYGRSMFIYFFFLLYNIVLVLPYINMNPPQNCLPKWVLQFAFPSAMHESFYCHMFSPAFIVTVLDFGHSNSYIMVSHFCFYLHFSGDNWYEATFHILFANLYISSLVRYLLKNLTHFVMGLFIFFLLF